MFKPHVLVIAFVFAGLLTLIHGGSETQVSGGAAAAALTDPTFADDLLAFEDRVRYQRQIEEVYWRHRIWPAENPGPKPTLDDVLPEAVIRERVATYLEKSAALKVVWQRPLTGEQLQAEMNRMVRGTKKPDLLRELFDAVDNDPLLIAECLARPLLVDRLTRNWYARDVRFHGALRERAEAALAGRSGEATPEDAGELRSETVWRLAPDDLGGPGKEPGSRHEVNLRIDEWDERIDDLARLFGVDRGRESQRTPGARSPQDRLPVGLRSGLIEEAGHFTVQTILSKTSNKLRVESITWSKRPLAAWWAEDGRAIVEAIIDRGGFQVSPPLNGYALPALPHRGCTADTWAEPAGGVLVEARYDHTAVWTGAEMVVWGGEPDGGPPLNSGGRYDPATDTWTLTSTGAGVPEGRLGHSAVWTGTEMIVWGGYDEHNAPENSGGRYDPLTDLWTPTSTGAGVPTVRARHSAVWTGTEMIVWGGNDFSSELNTGGRYDPTANTWAATSTGTEVPPGSTRHTAVWTGSEMIVWGGTNDGQALSSGGRYDPASDSWTATLDSWNVLSARELHTAVWTGSEMIVWGGYRSTFGYLATGGRYDPADDSWSATAYSGLPSSRAYHTAVWTGSLMIVWGGRSGSSHNTGGYYDPATDTWTTTSTGAGVPDHRRSHSAVWTGSEMIIWGGLGSTYRRDGGRYDPFTDSWVAVAAGIAAAPVATYAQAVWTGAEMIVWGGHDGTAPTNVGGRFNLATNSWTRTSDGIGVPTPRRRHVAVWTGTEMIVWGGLGLTYLSDGGRYNPATDNWASTSMGLNVLEPRDDHTAVWTGTEMIVWGGENDDTYLNTGGRYDPATNAWAATSLGVNVPEPRAEHTAVWTDAEMIIWGGYAAGDLDTGGRYDPVANAWTPTSTGTDLPEERRRHTAVWTGSEMIVWGGYGEGSGLPDLKTGARYDPVEDTWWRTTTTDAPARRSRHTAIWTGTEMIVWGGRFWFFDEVFVLNTGGRYDPVSDEWTSTSTEAGVPAHRRSHVMVWTGTVSIVWGGSAFDDLLPNGGLYCTCEGDSVSTWYPDADGDGLGASTTGIPSCEQPPGHVAVAGDCDDRFAGCTTDCTDLDQDGTPACAPDCDETNPYCTTDCTDSDADGACVTHDCDDVSPETHPGAPEINDGLDNQCAGDAGYGIVDEIGGLSGFYNASDRNEYSWPPQGGATAYKVARSSDRRFAADCTPHVASVPYWDDGTPVPFDSCFYYLVRAALPNVGSWGVDSSGVERTQVCP